MFGYKFKVNNIWFYAV